MHPQPLFPAPQLPLNGREYLNLVALAARCRYSLSGIRPAHHVRVCPQRCLDAIPYALTSNHPSKSPFQWNDFGFELDGPVRIPKLFNGKNRLFFMANDECKLQRQNSQVLYILPTVAMFKGNEAGLSTTYARLAGLNGATKTPFPNHVIPATRLDPLPDEPEPSDTYRFAANCYMLRSKYPKAIPALRKSIAIERSSNLRFSDAYLMLSAAYTEVGDVSHATDAHAGALNQLSLREALVQLYQNGMDPKSFALKPGPGGPAINPTCPIVHAHVCHATQEADLAQTRKKMFIEQFGCPLQPLE